MVIAIPVIDENGQFIGNTDNVKNRMAKVFTDIWRGFVVEGVIREVSDVKDDNTGCEDTLLCVAHEFTRGEHILLLLTF